MNTSLLFPDVGLIAERPGPIALFCNHSTAERNGNRLPENILPSQSLIERYMFT